MSTVRRRKNNRAQRWAIVGVGYIGSIHARIAAQIPGVRLVAISDFDAARARQVAATYGTRAVPHYRSLLGRIDAAIIAVPTAGHADTARFFLDGGVHTFIEKPICDDAATASRLVQLARRKGVTLQVGHSERFNPALDPVNFEGHSPTLIEAQRLGPYSFRSTDVSVVLDLMIHDIDLCLAYAGAPVAKVTASGITVIGPHCDVAMAKIQFRNGTVAHLTASRVHTCAVRLFRAATPTVQFEADLARRVTTEMRASTEARVGTPTLAGAASAADRFAQLLPRREFQADVGIQPIERELVDFRDAIRDGRAPRVTGAHGRDALQIALAIDAAVRRDQAAQPTVAA